MKILLSSIMRAFASFALAAAMQLAYAAPPPPPPHPFDPKVDPGVFVGAFGDCGVGYPAGSEIVAAGWVKDFGLPDDKGKDNQGLQLAKNGATADCSAAGADIKHVEGITLTELGFDYRNGFHCGAGAPRFNVVTTDGLSFAGGCSNGTHTPVPGQSGWTRVRIDPTNPAQMFPVIPSGATVLSISIIFDEGTDTGPDLTGFATLDNIDINGTLVDKK